MTSPRTVIRPLSLYVLLVLALLVGACSQGVPQTGSNSPIINLELTDSAVSAPASTPAGITTISVNNTSQVNRSVNLARLNTGVTIEQFMSQLAADDIEAVKLVSLSGGRDVRAGQTEQVILDLKEGTYVIVAFPESDDPPLTTSFQVGAASGAQTDAPAAAVTVDMGDFYFTMPDSVQSGNTTWEITNSGQQWHELQVIKPNEGFTQEQFMEMVMNDQPPSGDPPFEEIAFFGLASQGERGWMNFDLEPGTYWAVCFLPDVAGDGQPHIAKGMIKEFTVR